MKLAWVLVGPLAIFGILVIVGVVPGLQWWRGLWLLLPAGVVLLVTLLSSGEEPDAESRRKIGSIH